MKKVTGRLTLPSEANFLEQTKEMMARLGADALRDSDGTKLPEEVKDLDAQIYTTYFVAREHNDFARKHLSERQQCYLMTEFVTAEGKTLSIPLLRGFFEQQIELDLLHDPVKYWQVIDRTTGETVLPEQWRFDEATGTVLLRTARPYHQYTVDFLAYIAWDPTSMYNHLTNDWGDREHQIPFNAMAPNSSAFMEAELERWLRENPKTDIVRFTTFFYHFTLIFNDLAREKYVDWFGYSASVSAEAMDAFEKEKGYRLMPEDIVDEGYYNNPFRVPSRAFRDYLDFLSRFVAEKARRLVDLVHRYGKKAVMFLGDNWIGTEPYGRYFAQIGLDGVVGSVGDGVTLRLISDIPNVAFTEGRFLPYFFPDTFYEGNDPSVEAQKNWLTARRAIMRKPVQRIGYGGYLSLAYQFPRFTSYIERIADEYRDILSRIEGQRPYTFAKVAVLNCWGELRRWQPYIVAHGKWYKRCYSYMGMMEALAGMDVEVVFLSFDEVAERGVDSSVDVIINAGDAGTAWSGGTAFGDARVTEALRRFVYEGGGLIGVGEPSALPREGRYFQLADLFGVDREMGFSQSTNRYFNQAQPAHFITQDEPGPIALERFGEPVTNLYATDAQTQILSAQGGEIQMAAREVGEGRSFYVTGLPYCPENVRLLKRAIHYVARRERQLCRYYAEPAGIEVAAYPQIRQYAVLNNGTEPCEGVVYDGEGRPAKVHLAPGEIRWFEE
ncbi:MAG: 1,3-beta-galactosyl-N-acetylhexosamine phosphorylase [Ndongobacter sp.]|nr:1,3-beta-galactosyl-N-acetylhexosamine phosphorylase [Ndongobacter sp.]